MECPILKRCVFFRKYGMHRRPIASVLIADFCRGEEAEKCERQKYKKLYGKDPSPDMAPNGEILKEE